MYLPLSPIVLNQHREHARNSGSCGKSRDNVGSADGTCTGAVGSGAAEPSRLAGVPGRLRGGSAAGDGCHAALVWTFSAHMAQGRHSVDVPSHHSHNDDRRCPCRFESVFSLAVWCTRWMRACGSSLCHFPWCCPSQSTPSQALLRFSLRSMQRWSSVSSGTVLQLVPSCVELLGGRLEGFSAAVGRLFGQQWVRWIAIRHHREGTNGVNDVDVM